VVVLLVVEPLTELADVPTAALSVLVLMLAVRSLDAHPAKNMKPAIRIASFCIVLLF
jgi:hypothetical protein